MGFACVPKTCDTLMSTLSDFWYAVRNSWTVVQFCFMLEAWKDCTPISGHFLMKPEHYEMKITSVVTLTEQYRWHKRLRAGLTNLWHAYPKWRAERYSCHPAFAVTPIIFYSFCPTDVSILWRIRTYVHTHTHIPRTHHVEQAWAECLNMVNVCLRNPFHNESLFGKSTLHILSKSKLRVPADIRHKLNPKNLKLQPIKACDEDTSARLG